FSPFASRLTTCQVPCTLLVSPAGGSFAPASTVLHRKPTNRKMNCRRIVLVSLSQGVPLLPVVLGEAPDDSAEQPMAGANLTDPADERKPNAAAHAPPTYGGTGFGPAPDVRRRPAPLLGRRSPVLVRDPEARPFRGGQFPEPAGPGHGQGIDRPGTDRAVGG